LAHQIYNALILLTPEDGLEGSSWSMPSSARQCTGLSTAVNNDPAHHRSPSDHRHRASVASRLGGREMWRSSCKRINPVHAFDSSARSAASHPRRWSPCQAAVSKTGSSPCAEVDDCDDRPSGGGVARSRGARV